MRHDFEKIISDCPYEMELSKFPLSDKSSWPGQYLDYQVQLASDFWKAATESCLAILSEVTGHSIEAMRSALYEEGEGD